MTAERLRGFRRQLLKINRENSSNAKNFWKRKKKIIRWNSEKWINRKTKEYWEITALLVNIRDSEVDYKRR